MKYIFPSPALSVKLKISVIFCVFMSVLIFSGCANNKDVERVESSVNVQDQKIGNLKEQIAQVDQKRSELHEEVLALKLSDDFNAREFSAVFNELKKMDKQYENLNFQLNTLLRSESANGDKIEQMELQDARRKEIIRQHNEKWKNITESTDRQLSDLDKKEKSEFTTVEN